MESYFKHAARQYAKARGIELRPLNEIKDCDDFWMWVEERQKLGREFAYLLNDIGYNFGDSNCAEIGKGNGDSIVQTFNTTIISPFTKYFNKQVKKRTIEATVKAINGQPCLVKNEGKGSIVTPIPIDIIDTYLFHNITTKDELSGWNEVVENTDVNIILGVFGNIKDKDLKDRIEIVESFIDNLDGIECLEEFETKNEGYIYTAGVQKTKGMSRFK